MAAPRRRHVATTTKKPTQRVNLQIDADAYQRLLLHSIMNKEQPGAIVSRLIEDHLRQWAMPADLTARSREKDRQDPAGPVNLEVPPLAIAG